MHVCKHGWRDGDSLYGRLRGTQEQRGPYLKKQNQLINSRAVNPALYNNWSFSIITIYAALAIYGFITDMRSLTEINVHASWYKISEDAGEFVDGRSYSSNVKSKRDQEA